jgi:butyrate kinase
MIDSSPDVLTVALAVTPQGWMSVPPAPELPSHPLVTLLFSFAYTTQASRSLHLVAGVFGYCHKNSCQVTCDV